MYEWFEGDKQGQEVYFNESGTVTKAGQNGTWKIIELKKFSVKFGKTDYEFTFQDDA